MTKLALIFGPQCEPFQPYASLPYLAGFLRHHGLDVLCIDANVESFHYLFCAERMAAFAARVQNRYRQMTQAERLSPEERQELEVVARAALVAEAVVQGVDDARETLGSWRGIHDYSAYARSWRLIQEGFQVLSAAHYPTRIAVNHYGANWGVSSIEELYRASLHHEACVFSPFFAEAVLPRIEAFRPDLVGLSVISEGQAIPSFVLATMLRNRTGKDVHLAVGGTFFSRFKDALLANPRLFDLVDSFTLHEGEHGLLQLARAAASGGSMEAVPNTLSRCDGRIVCGADRVEPYDEMPAPDPSGLPLEQYVAPAPIFPLHQSRGCYWNRCTFCNHRGLKFHEEYRPRDPQRLYGDIVSLVERHGMRFFTLWDESVDPAALEALCDMLIAGGCDVQWRCVARFEAHFTADLCRLMVRAGCRGILFGFESGCPRILDNMRKGTSLATTSEVLANCRAAGISTYLSAIVGYPSETLAEARETISFVNQQRKNIDHVALSTFELARGSTIANEPAAFGISEVDWDPGNDLRLYYAFVPCQGMTRAEAWDAHKEMFREFDSMGVSSYNLVHSGPHFLFFASVYGPGGLSHLSRLERHRDNGMPDRTADSRLRLAASVVVEPHGPFAFERQRCRVLRLSEGVLKLLDFCDGTRSAPEVIGQFAELRGRAESDIAPALWQTIEALCGYGILEWKGGAPGG